MTARTRRLRSIAEQLGTLVVEKNQAYGNSFERAADFLRLLYPGGLHERDYADAVVVTRIFDKLMRIASRKHAFGESPYRDIAGYALLGLERDERQAKRPLTDVELALQKRTGVGKRLLRGPR